MEMTEELCKDINENTDWFVEWLDDGTWILGKKNNG